MASTFYDVLKNIEVPDVAGIVSRGLSVGQDYKQNQLKQDLTQQQIDTAHTADQVKQAALARQQAYAKDVGNVLANPSPDGYRSLMLKYPEEHDALTGGAKVYNDDQRDRNVQAATEVYGLLQNGNTDAALRRLQDRKTALQNGGESTEVTDQLISDIQSGDPARIKQAQGLAGYALSGLLGEKAPDVIASLHKDQTDQQIAPAQIQKANAEASSAQTEAQFAPQKAAADLSNIQSQIDDRSARLGLDRDKLTTDTQLRLDQMDLSRVPDSAKGTINTLVLGASSSMALAGQSRDLADKFSTSDVKGRGALSSFSEFLARQTGNQDAVSQLRSQYQQIVNSAAIKNLPPGPASDKDVALARQGFPPASASKDTIVNWLRGFAKLQDLSANAQQSQADWIAANGSLAPLKRDANVNGVRVPAGSNYSDFVKSGSATTARNQGVQPTRSRYGL